MLNSEWIILKLNSKTTGWGFEIFVKFISSAHDLKSLIKHAFRVAFYFFFLVKLKKQLLLHVLDIHNRSIAKMSLSLKHKIS